MNKTTDIFYIFFSLLFFQKEILYTARSLLSLTLTFSKMPLVEFTFPAALKNVWEKKTGNPVPTESEMIDLDTAKADIPFEVDLNQLRNDTSLREMVRGTLAISLGMPQGSLATVPCNNTCSCVIGSAVKGKSRIGSRKSCEGWRAAVKGGEPPSRVV